MESGGFHKTLPRDPILSQLNAVQAFTPNLLEDPFQHLSIKTEVSQVNLEVLWLLLYRFSGQYSVCIPYFPHTF